MVRGFSVRRRLLDRMCLIPSRHPLDCSPQARFWVESQGLKLECFRQIQVPNSLSSNEWRGPSELGGIQTEALIVKWAGNAGRAELSTLHPANAWPDRCIEVWTINPPGYGGSSGRASLDHVRAMAAAIWEATELRLPEIPVVAFGNSIGTLSALHFARQGLASRSGHRIRGIFLRNPPHLATLILQHYRRWYHGAVPAWLIRAWGPEIDSVGLATNVRCPLFMLQSQRDRLVPPMNQDRVFEAHCGPKQKFIFEGADHNEMPSSDDLEIYKRYLAAIRDSFPRLFS